MRFKVMYNDEEWVEETKNLWESGGTWDDVFEWTPNSLQSPQNPYGRLVTLDGEKVYFNIENSDNMWPIDCLEEVNELEYLYMCRKVYKAKGTK